MVYRRGKERMSASEYEQDHATGAGVRIIYGAAPVKVLGAVSVEGVEFAYTVEGANGLEMGERFTLKADQVFKAIGQTLVGPPIAQDGAKLVKQAGRVWAGGDCAAGGEDLTVTAVAEGRDAAEAIHASLMA
jgi:dihydropyrimidine dehydrogenase (NAD+) subunit PreT